jgi:hypothetical protein
LLFPSADGDWEGIEYPGCRFPACSFAPGKNRELLQKRILWPETPTNYREQHPPGVSHELGDPQQLPEPFSANLSGEALEVL